MWRAGYRGNAGLYGLALVAVKPVVRVTIIADWLGRRALRGCWKGREN